MTIAIEPLSLIELKVFLREQSIDAFPSLQDESRLVMLAEKWHAYAEFCTCRDDDQRLIGMIAFYANQPETRMAYIPHVYVSPNHRREGLFSKMLEFIEESIRTRGFKEIKLEVDKDNLIAQSVYLKEAFSVDNSPIGKTIFMRKSIKT